MGAGLFLFFRDKSVVVTLVDAHTHQPIEQVEGMDTLLVDHGPTFALLHAPVPPGVFPWVRVELPPIHAKGLSPTIENRPDESLAKLSG